MAGKKGRSGRRPAAEEAGLAEPGAPRPELAQALGEIGATESSIAEYLGRLAAAYLGGLCTLAEMKDLAGIANAAARVLGRGAARRELDELRAMLERTEALERAGLANEAADRQHRADGPERAQPPNRRDPGQG